MQNKITPRTIYRHRSASKLCGAIIRSLPTWTPGTKRFATWALYEDRRSPGLHLVLSPHILHRIQNILVFSLYVDNRRVAAS